MIDPNRQSGAEGSWSLLSGSSSRSFPAVVPIVARVVVTRAATAPSRVAPDPDEGADGGSCPVLLRRDGRGQWGGGCYVRWHSICDCAGDLDWERA